jgi:hypothetical protein
MCKGLYHRQLARQCRKCVVQYSVSSKVSADQKNIHHGRTNFHGVRQDMSADILHIWAFHVCTWIPVCPPSASFTACTTLGIQSTYLLTSSTEIDSQTLVMVSMSPSHVIGWCSGCKRQPLRTCQSCSMGEISGEFGGCLNVDLACQPCQQPGQHIAQPVQCQWPSLL